MKTWTRNLPHQIPEHTILFVTWRLAGTVPQPVPELLVTNPVKIPHPGPCWLKDPRIARVVVDALLHGATKRGFYRLCAYVVMPNHVHTLIEPFQDLSVIMHWIKGATARRANRILGLTGTAFWQDESYDHWIRCGHESRSLVAYIENNSVKAGWRKVLSYGRGRVPARLPVPRISETLIRGTGSLAACPADNEKRDLGPDGIRCAEDEAS